MRLNIQTHMKEIIIIRKDLYDLVWSSPISTISKKYIISYNELKKICTNMNIPLPKPGHWEKLRAGKIVKIEELTSFSGLQEVKLLLREEGDEDFLSPIDILKKNIESDPTLPLTVPEKLIKPDKLIIDAQNELKTRQYCELNIRVSRNKDMQDRALRFMDTFIKLMRARGHDIKIVDSNTCAMIEGEKFKIYLTEKNKRIKSEDRWGSSTYEPTGIFILKMDVSYNTIEWYDGKVPLEEQLAKILAKIEIKVKEYKEEQRLWEIRRQEQAEKERIKRERIDRENKELSDFKELLQDVNRWRQAMILINYIDAMEEKAIASNAVSDEFKKWLEWARKKADWYHPHINGEDDFLKEVDKETLTFKRKSTYW